MPSKEGMTKGTFIETQILPYSLISFYGIINENAAQSTNLTEDDVKILFDGIWNGTKNLITRSKIGQVPRYLMNVVYKKENFHIGDLDRKIKLIPKGGKKDKEYRSIADFSLNANDLIQTLENNKNSVERIELKIDDDIRFFLTENKEGGKKEFIELLKGKGLAIAEFTFT
jgi:CRISPR-associated protein Csh2